MNNNIKYTYYPKLNEYSEGYFEDKKSKFYSYIYNISDIEEIQNILENIKKENKRG